MVIVLSSRVFQQGFEAHPRTQRPAPDRTEPGPHQRTGRGKVRLGLPGEGQGHPRQQFSRYEKAHPNSGCAGFTADRLQCSVITGRRHQSPGYPTKGNNKKQQKQQVAGVRVSGCRDPAGDTAIPAAPAQPGLHRHHAGQETGGGRRPAEGAGDRGSEQQDGATVLRAAGKADRMTGRRQLRQMFIPDQATARRSTCSCSPLSPFGSVRGRTN